MIPVLIGGALGLVVGYGGSKLLKHCDDDKNKKKEETTKRKVSEEYVMNIIKKSNKKLRVD